MKPAQQQAFEARFGQRPVYVAPDDPAKQSLMRGIYDRQVDIYQGCKLGYTAALADNAAVVGELVGMLEPEKLARAFHDNYERLAPQFGYVTREDTRVFKPDSPNGKLMLAVCAEISRAALAKVGDISATGD